MKVQDRQNGPSGLPEKSGWLRAWRVSLKHVGDWLATLHPLLRWEQFPNLKAKLYPLVLSYVNFSHHFRFDTKKSIHFQTSPHPWKTILGHQVKRGHGW